jgi:hypothetical protein
MTRRDCLLSFVSLTVLTTLMLGAPSAVRLIVHASPADNPEFRSKMFALLRNRGKSEILRPEDLGQVGFNNGGQPIPVTRVMWILGVASHSFAKIELGTAEYMFYFDRDRDRPKSFAQIFRFDQNFQVIANGAQWINKIPRPMSARETSEAFNERLKNWEDIVG